MGEEARGRGGGMMGLAPGRVALFSLPPAARGPLASVTPSSLAPSYGSLSFFCGSLLHLLPCPPQSTSYCLSVWLSLVFTPSCAFFSFVTPSICCCISTLFCFCSYTHSKFLIIIIFLSRSVCFHLHFPFFSFLLLLH